MWNWPSFGANNRWTRKANLLADLRQIHHALHGRGVIDCHHSDQCAQVDGQFTSPQGLKSEALDNGGYHNGQTCSRSADLQGTAGQRTDHETPNYCSQDTH